mgnify:CR=1 FL=1
MKIAINIGTQKKSFGGGNQFLNILKKHLKSKKITIKEDLIDDDLDIILIIDPRTRHPMLNFSIGNIFRYIKYKNPNAIVVHRINECDERKKTSYMNKLLKNTNIIADHTIFVAKWLKKLDLWQKKNHSVITNGSEKKIFKKSKKKVSVPPYKIVTHHWSDNKMKGYEIYKKIDDLLNQKFWKDKITFTYIGRISNKQKFNNTRFIKPLNGNALSKQISKHHIYVTGSLNEPGGNHQNEGALCGLPLLYINSGCFPEYCKGYGENFTSKTLEKSLLKIIKNYKIYSKKMKFYPHTSYKMVKEYENLFNNLIKNKRTILQNRRKKFNFKTELKFLMKI